MFNNFIGFVIWIKWFGIVHLLCIGEEPRKEYGNSRSVFGEIPIKFFIKIPIIGSSNLKVTFDMIVNTENKSVTVDLATGINEINENSLSMFPNPVTNELTINNISKNSTISIYDLNGRLIINKISKSEIEKIDVSNLTNGIYLIKVSDKKAIITSKFVKQ